MDKDQMKKDKEQSMKHKLGDAIERVGEKLTSMGASKIGKSVYNAGNKLEHEEDSDKGTPV